MSYSPTLGRWMEQDPTGYIDGANRYQFVGDEPVACSDPLGLIGLKDPNPIPPGFGDLSDLLRGASPQDGQIGISKVVTNLTVGWRYQTDFAFNWRYSGKIFYMQNIIHDEFYDQRHSLILTHDSLAIDIGRLTRRGGMFHFFDLGEGTLAKDLGVVGNLGLNCGYWISQRKSSFRLADDVTYEDSQHHLFSWLKSGSPTGYDYTQYGTYTGPNGNTLGKPNAEDPNDTLKGAEAFNAIGPNPVNGQLTHSFQFDLQKGTVSYEIHGVMSNGTPAKVSKKNVIIGT